MQGEIKVLTQEEIGKISGDIDSANTDMDSSMDEQLQVLDERMVGLRASAEKQINELQDLHVLQFLSESRYRELKSRFWQRLPGEHGCGSILRNSERAESREAGGRVVD